MPAGSNETQGFCAHGDAAFGKGAPCCPCFFADVYHSGVALFVKVTQFLVAHRWGLTLI
jgi:hypothetical protein